MIDTVPHQPFAPRTPADDYASLSSSTRLWDGTLLSDLHTPVHDLTQRARPFPLQRNYFHDQAVSESAQWLRAAVGLGPAEYERLLAEDVGGFVSWVYPDATAGQIRALVDFHNWAVWVDDLIDRRSTLETSLSACTLLETLGATELAPFDDFYPRMRALDMDDRHGERFIAAMHLYGASSREEVEAREGRTGFSSVADYVRNRRASAAMPVYNTLTRWISRIDLSDETLRHPLVVRLENCCNDYSMLYNDAGSFVKELLAGRSEGTFVRLLSDRMNLSVQQTLCEVIDMAAAAADDLESTSDAIESCELARDVREQVHRYADGLRKYVAGVNYWSNRTCRYFVGQPVMLLAPISRAGDVHRLRDGIDSQPRACSHRHK
ncbi:terpene synthase family protein [Nocardia brasiliensis]|uniref:terpene synthase family protein n=1 Tax=Nocardia brasiliensis TaxID=37326 RepID=UPI0024555F18|nr:hypothetical protein [Nocardia brasiliensis]